MCLNEEFHNPLLSRSLSIALSAPFLFLSSSFYLQLRKGADVMKIAFETVSAFGTVGLSAGLQPGNEPSRTNFDYDYDVGW